MNKYKKIIGIALIGAPLLMLLADANWLVFGHLESFWFGSVTMWLSFYLFVGLIIGLYHLSNQSKLALAGTMIAIFGVLAGATIMGLDRVGWAMHEIGLGNEVSRTVSHPRVFFTSRFVGLTFPIGLILLSISLYKAKVLNLMWMLILIIGIILFPVGRIVVGFVANVPGDLIMLFIYGKLGINLLNKSKQLF